MSWTTPFAEAMKQLDTIGFNYGHTRVSLYHAFIAIIVVVGVFVAARLISNLVKWLFRRMTRLDPAQQLLGEKLVLIGVWIMAILIGIDLLGISLTALTVFSGAFGLAIGFGLQKTFGNLIAGIILLMDRSIKPGDVIAVNDGKTVGQVKKIGIRAVSITTRDKIEYLIPNEVLMINQVENWSYSSRDVRIKVPVGVAYSSDLALAEVLMLQAARETTRVLKQPAPSLWMIALADNAVQFEIQIWINDPEEGVGNVKSDVLRGVLKLFTAHGVALPNVQREINIRNWSERPPPS